jgi:hypothetical protein
VVPWRFHLGQLHRVIQAAFGWWDYHATKTGPSVGTGTARCVITTEGICLDARKNGQIGGSDVVRDAWNVGSTAEPAPWLPRNPTLCYRSRQFGSHLGNLGLFQTWAASS